jgi:cell pole-organizing protein PopZ
VERSSSARSWLVAERVQRVAQCVVERLDRWPISCCALPRAHRHSPPIRPTCSQKPPRSTPSLVATAARVRRARSPRSRPSGSRAGMDRDDRAAAPQPMQCGTSWCGVIDPPDLPHEDGGDRRSVGPDHPERSAGEHRTATRTCRRLRRSASAHCPNDRAHATDDDHRCDGQHDDDNPLEAAGVSVGTGVDPADHDRRGVAVSARPRLGETIR